MKWITMALLSFGLLSCASSSSQLTPKELAQKEDQYEQQRKELVFSRFHIGRR